MLGMYPSRTQPLRSRGVSGAGYVIGDNDELRRGGGAHKSDQPLLSFSGSKLSCHLRHIDSKMVEAMEGLLWILYDRFDGIIYRPHLARIFIVLGRDIGGGGGGLRVA